VGQKRKRDELDTLWDKIFTFQDCFVPYQNETIEKWGSKTMFAAGVNFTRFKAINRGLLEQIEQILSNPARLIKKSQLKRERFKVLGKKVQIENSTDIDVHLDDYDEEIYDDGDFLSSLLREIMDSSNSGSDISHLFPQRKKYATATKVERQSKGKRLRYTVHEHLRSFMAPQPDKYPLYNTDVANQLFASLFGNRNLVP